MALFLLYSDLQQTRNSTGRNAIIVDGADEAAARTKAGDNIPDGETSINDWAALEIAATAGASFPTEGYVWLQGNVVEPLLPAEANAVTPLARRALMAAAPAILNAVLASQSPENRALVPTLILMTCTPNCGLLMM